SRSTRRRRSRCRATWSRATAPSTSACRPTTAIRRTHRSRACGRPTRDAPLSLLRWDVLGHLLVHHGVAERLVQPDRDGVAAHDVEPDPAVAEVHGDSLGGRHPLPPETLPAQLGLDDGGLDPGEGGDLAATDPEIAGQLAVEVRDLDDLVRRSA